MAPWGFREFYRRGPYGVLSFEGVSQLRKLGLRRLEAGLPECGRQLAPSIETTAP
jgi:hypothetical protein